MKSIIQFLSFILLLQSCSSSSNNEFVNLVNDILVEKEAFVEKTISSSEIIVQEDFDEDATILLKSHNYLWNKIEIIENGNSHFIYSDDFNYENSLNKEVYFFNTTYKAPITLRYHGINAIFDTTILIKKGDIIPSPFSIETFYHKVFEQSPNIKILINDKEVHPKERKMIPLNFLLPSKNDTVYIAAEHIGCYDYSLESYLYYRENDSIIFKKNDAFDDNIHQLEILENKVSLTFFDKTIHRFRENINEEMGMLSSSNTEIAIIKNEEIAIINNGNINSLPLIELLKAVKLINKEEKKEQIL